MTEQDRKYCDWAENFLYAREPIQVIANHEGSKFELKNRRIEKHLIRIKYRSQGNPKPVIHHFRALILPLV